jgi:hypothetical protein
VISSQWFERGAKSRAQVKSIDDEVDNSAVVVVGGGDSHDQQPQLTADDTDAQHLLVHKLKTKKKKSVLQAEMANEMRRRRQSYGSPTLATSTTTPVSSSISTSMPAPTSPLATRRDLHESVSSSRVPATDTAWVPSLDLFACEEEYDNATDKPHGGSGVANPAKKNMNVDESIVTSILDSQAPMSPQQQLPRGISNGTIDEVRNRRLCAVVFVIFTWWSIIRV